MIQSGYSSRLDSPRGSGAACRLLSALGLTILLMAPSAFAQGTLLYSIPPPANGLQPGGQLGHSVAIDGPYTVIGARFDDLSGRDSGAVKVFNSTTGALLFLLSDPVPEENKFFGESLAISGTRVIVGDPADDTGAAAAGSAYVYDLLGDTPSIPVAILHNPAPALLDRFGAAVSISGTRVVVGANSDDAGASDSGSAYVYDLSSGTPTSPVATLGNPSPAVGDSFGRSVAISGTRIVVGATGADANTGGAYVFDLLSGTPSIPVAILSNPSPQLFESFGRAVAIFGMRVIVGAGQGREVHVYDLASATPAIPALTISDPGPGEGPINAFGSSVAISGPRVIVGARWADTGATESGASYIYDLSTAAPTVAVATLNNPSPSSKDWFGTSVAISGARVVVGAEGDDAGAQNAGSAYGYDLLGATPTAVAATFHSPGPALLDRFGISVSVSGPRVVVGASMENTAVPAGGSAHVYDLRSGTPTVPIATLRKPNPEEFDQFGGAVAISGTRVVVGAFWDNAAASVGSAYVYDLNSPTPGEHVFVLTNPAPSLADQFGFSVAISGTWAVVGAPSEDEGSSNSGSAYVYDLSSATPTVPVVTLHSPNLQTNAYFGHSVAISGTRVVVGASGAAGGVYIYDLGSGTPAVPVATLTNPAPGAGGVFGYSVSVFDDRVVVGVPGALVGAFEGGRAYVFDLESAGPNAPSATLDNPDPANDDRFGHSVAISGARVLVGGNGAYSNTGNNGSAYLFDLQSVTPAVPVAALHNPTPDADDQFGSSVAIDGGTTVVGAPFDDALGLDRGHVYVFGGPEVSISGNAVNIADGDGTPDTSDHTDFGHADVTAGTVVRSFTISNQGPMDLTLGAVMITGANVADFSVTTQPASLVAPGGATTFQVTFDPRANGLRSATLSFSNNDADETPFDFAIQGVGTGTPPSRVFVGTSGSDANVCMDQTTPCRHPAAAIAQVAVDGEVIVLTSGAYGTAPILIAKGVKITAASGTVAFIRQPIVVNAPGGHVALTGLTLKGSGTGSAITLAAADSLSIDETTMDSWDRGLDIAAAAPSNVSITRCYLLRNQFGILDGGSAAHRVAVGDSRFEWNGSGLYVALGTFVVRQGFFVSNTAGARVIGGQLEITRSEVWSNGTGILATSVGALRISRSHIFGNTIGAKASGGGMLASFGTNVIRGNGTDIDGALAIVPEQ